MADDVNNDWNAFKDYLIANRHDLIAQSALKDKPKVVAADSKPNFFYREVLDKGAEDTSKRGHFYRKGGEAKFIAVGAIAEASTKHSAIGNTYIDTNESWKTKVIDDKQKHIKHQFALTVPDSAPDLVQKIVRNQLKTISTIAQIEEKTKSDHELGRPNSPLKHNPYTRETDLVAILFGPVYTVPSVTFTPHVAVDEGKGKEKLDFGEGIEDDTDDNDDIDDKADGIDIVMEDATEPQDTPPPREVTIGDAYDVKILFDHDGTMFNHINAKVAQPNLRDKNDNLVRPDHEYNALRPGTVISAEVTMESYFAYNKRNFSLSAHSIAIVLLFSWSYCIVL